MSHNQTSTQLADNAQDLDAPLSMREFCEFILQTYRVPVTADSLRRYRSEGLWGKKLKCFKFAGRIYGTRRAAFEFFGTPPSQSVPETANESDPQSLVPTAAKEA